METEAETFGDGACPSNLDGIEITEGDFTAKVVTGNTGGNTISTWLEISGGGFPAEAIAYANPDWADIGEVTFGLEEENGNYIDEHTIGIGADWVGEIDDDIKEFKLCVSIYLEQFADSDWLAEIASTED